ncbi:MAG TPA: GNAT family N-acetyltransferase [Acidobacteriaceae bacterium]|nr:GNAT family N-acetyltransferase [Acidobacteriaceae bacterium]
MTSALFPDDTSIRIATLEDVDGIVSVQASAPEAAQWSRAVYADMMTARMPPGIGYRRVIFVAMHTTAILGFAVVGTLQLTEATECELENMAVAPAWRRRGLGRRLVEKAIHWCVEQKTSQVLLEVRASNIAAMELYEGMGFQHVGRRLGYYRQPSEDAMQMAWKPAQSAMPGC